MQTPPSPDEAVWEPGLYPVSLDLGSRTVLFAAMSDVRYRTLPFHDLRYVAGAETFVAGIDDIIDAFVDDAEPGGARYIFHTGFCGSTLLSRALDVPGAHFGYREPQLWTDLARGCEQLSDSERPAVVRGVDRMLDACVGDETAVVKLHNGCARLAASILTVTARPALLLYSTLEEFLVSVVAHPRRRAWARRQLHLFASDCVFGAVQPVDELDDAVVAALLWAWQMECYREVMEAGCAVRTLRDGVLYDHPGRSLWNVALQLELGLSEVACLQISRGPLMGMNSKSGAAYDYERRRRQRDAVREQFAKPLGAARAWVADRSDIESAVIGWPSVEAL